MPDELYKSPAFQFYADDFIADTSDLTAEEVGVYMRLLCHQWKQGSIPTEAPRQALIGGVSVQAMKRSWKMLSRMFESSASGFIQPRLERVREAAKAHALAQAARGKKGAEARWGSDSLSNGASMAQVMPKHDASNAYAVPSTMLADGSPVSSLHKDAKASGASAPFQPPLPTKEPSDLAAWLILDAAWDVVSAQHDLAIKRTAWRSHNKRAAKDLAESGKTPEQVANILSLAYTHPDGSRYYGGITTLAKLIEHWPKIAALEDEDLDPISRGIANGGIRVY